MPISISEVIDRAGRELTSLTRRFWTTLAFRFPCSSRATDDDQSIDPSLQRKRLGAIGHARGECLNSKAIGPVAQLSGLPSSSVTEDRANDLSISRDYIS
jgi:hypothetical protein